MKSRSKKDLLTQSHHAGMTVFVFSAVCVPGPHRDLARNPDCGSIAVLGRFMRLNYRDRHSTHLLRLLAHQRENPPSTVTHVILLAGREKGSTLSILNEVFKAEK